MKSFFLSEKDADEEVKCFLNQEGTIEEPCGQNLAMKVKYGLDWVSKDEVKTRL